MKSAPDARWASPATLAVLLGPALLIYAAFTVYPVLRTFWNSVHTIKPHNIEEFVGLANFKQLLGNDWVFWKAVRKRRFSPSSQRRRRARGLLLALRYFRAPPSRALARRLVPTGSDVVRGGRHHLGRGFTTMTGAS